MSSSPVVQSNLKRSMSMDSPSLATLTMPCPSTPPTSYKKRACGYTYRTPPPITTTYESYHDLSPPPTPRGCKTVIRHFFLDDAAIRLLALPELAPVRRPLQDTQVNLPAAFPIFPDPTFLKPRVLPMRAFYEENDIPTRSATPTPMSPLFPRSMLSQEPDPSVEERDEAPLEEETPSFEPQLEEKEENTTAQREEEQEEDKEANKDTSKTRKATDHRQTHGRNWRPTMPHVEEANPKVHEYARCA